MEKTMHPYKRALVALTVAAAIVSQSPAIARAEEGDHQYSSSHCYMSRMVNGSRWTSTDCNEIQSEMSREMEGIRNMLGRMAAPPVSMPVPEPVNMPDAESPSMHDLEAVLASIYQLLFRYIPLFR
jgi:hypothetical protein